MTIALYVLLGFALDLAFAVVVGRMLAGRPVPHRPVHVLRLPDNARVSDKFVRAPAGAPS